MFYNSNSARIFAEIDGADDYCSFVLVQKRTPFSINALHLMIVTYLLTWHFGLLVCQLRVIPLEAFQLRFDHFC